jgi:pilus assembly protein Flp/PilA
MLVKDARLARDASGATAAEYAIMAALIAVVIVAAVFGVGEAVIALFHEPELTDALN